MSATDSLPLTLARTTATAGLGFAVGITASIPLWTFPALYAPSARNTAVDRLRAWSGIYSSGKTTMIAFIPTLTALLSYSAYATRKPISYLPHNFWGLHRKSILSLAALSTFSVMAWTIAAMEKLNGSLKDVEKKINKEVDAAPSSTTHSAQAIEADTLIKGKWSTLHNVRIALFTVAFGLSLGELAFA